MSPSPTRTRLPVLLAIAAVLAALFAVLVAPAMPAHAASYRFWGYYQLTDGHWAFATKGAAEVKPQDGGVEGWRFAISGDSGSAPRVPRATPSFADICGATAAADGKKRVGVVIDYGRAADGDGSTKPPAPAARCAVVDTAATGVEVLSAVAEPRVEKQLTCAIDGYPAQGCGDPVKDVPAAAKAADTPITIAPAATTPAATAPPTTPSAPATTTPATTTPATTQSATTPAGTADNPGSVEQGAATPTQKPAADAGTSVGTWISVVVILAVLAAAALVALRRRRQS